MFSKTDYRYSLGLLQMLSTNDYRYSLGLLLFYDLIAWRDLISRLIRCYRLEYQVFIRRAQFLNLRSLFIQSPSVSSHDPNLYKRIGRRRVVDRCSGQGTYGLYFTTIELLSPKMTSQPMFCHVLHASVYLVLLGLISCPMRAGLVCFGCNHKITRA